MIREIRLYRAECGLCGRQHVHAASPESAGSAARRSGWSVDGVEVQCPDCMAALDNLEEGEHDGRWSLLDQPSWSAVCCGGQVVSSLHGPQDLLRLLRAAEQKQVVCCGG